MTTTQEKKVTTPKPAPSTKPASPKPATQTVDDKALAKRKARFRALNLKFTMEAFEYCSRNDIDLATLVEFTPKNHRDLVMLSVPDLDFDRATEIMREWTQYDATESEREKSGYTLQMLHLLCLDSAKSGGFFINKKDMEAMGQMVQQDPTNITLMLQFLHKDLSRMVAGADSLTNNIL
jgi:hypothetical protein